MILEFWKEYIGVIELGVLRIDEIIYDKYDKRIEKVQEGIIWNNMDRVGRGGDISRVLEVLEEVVNKK